MNTKMEIGKKSAWTLLLVAMLSMNVFAQEAEVEKTEQPEKRILTLDECIQIAMDNNIQLKQARNNAEIAKAQNFQTLMEFLPSLDARANYDLYNGTFFDNTAARQVTEVTNSSNPNINASWTLFNGLSNHYSRKATATRLTASVSAIDEQKQSVEASVLGSYLSVVLDKENIKISEGRIELLEAQLQREERRNSVGVGDPAQVYNFRSQLANENLTLVNLKNTLLTDMLTLLQVLQLEVSYNYDVAPYELSENEYLLEVDNFSEVLESSLSYSPSLKRAMANSQASVYDFKVTRAGYLPTISAFGRIGSSYSSNGARNPENGEPDPNATFAEQMKWNKFDYANISINIPIFTNFRTRTNTQVAKINMRNAELDLDQQELSTTNQIQQVYLNLINAQETYKAAEENLVALDQSFDFVKTRYENGNTDFYTYLESLNNKNRAEIELVNAKYSIVFRKKILDVYRGLL